MIVKTNMPSQRDFVTRTGVGSMLRAELTLTLTRAPLNPNKSETDSSRAEVYISAGYQSLSDLVEVVLAQYQKLCISGAGNDEAGEG
mmetsp:Transcript_6932/g.15297  ORF Transcript_6932/g.15297 Transcript_6932/m.15297 type:complete len:87 (+) Transcript_6932:375-635(+)